MSAIATLHTDHRTQPTPRGATTNKAQREPKEKTGKPQQRVMMIARHMLVELDRRVHAGTPLVMSTNRQQDLQSELVDLIIRQEIDCKETKRKLHRKKRDEIVRDVVDYVVQRSLVDTGTFDRYPKRPAYMVVVSKDGYEFLEQRCRAMHPSAGGSRRRRSSQDANEEVAA